MRAWRVHEWGMPREAMKLDEVDVPAPAPGELLVRNQVIPLNLNDMERITGGNMMVRPDLPLIPGMETMGVVERGGEGVEDWAGRRVVATPKQATGGWAEYSLCPAHSAFDMPDDIPLPDAGALYFPFHLAYMGLVERAKLQAGESVLVHAAAGGSGSAAVQLAKSLGARVFATVGSEEKGQLAHSLGADVVIDYTKDDFAEIVMAETENKGVDVVFDNVGPSVMDASMSTIAYDGRYLMMGFASDKSKVDEPSITPRKISGGNFHLSGVLLSYAPDPVIPMMKKGMGWNFCPSEVGARIMAEIIELVRKGEVRPVIGKVIAFDDLPEAMQLLFDRGTTGRVLAQL